MSKRLAQFITGIMHSETDCPFGMSAETPVMSVDNITEEHVTMRAVWFVKGYGNVCKRRVWSILDIDKARVPIKTLVLDWEDDCNQCLIKWQRESKA